MQIQTQLANHVAAVGPAVLVGIACGVLGTIFTVLNIKVVRLRDTIIQVCPTLPWQRPSSSPALHQLPVSKALEFPIA